MYTPYVRRGARLTGVLRHGVRCALTARSEEAGCSERLLIVGGGSTAVSGGAARQPGGQQFQVRPLRLPDRPQRCCAAAPTADRCEHESVC